MKLIPIFIFFIFAVFNAEHSISQNGGRLTEEHLENGSFKDYYFKLEDFVEPKIYFYRNTSDPDKSVYWKLSVNLDSNLFITEAFDLDFDQFESFTEKFDSLGAKVVAYIGIRESDSTVHRIGASSDVYLWTSYDEYEYRVYDTRYINQYLYTKTRQFASIDSMEILGTRIEVIRFKDEYTFYEEGQEVFSMVRQSFYSKDYGLVRFLNFNEEDKTSQTFILKKILTEEEWLDLQK